MKRILNFGSLNTDYVYKVDHILQGGETIQSESRTVFPGGKGLNQSIALVREMCIRDRCVTIKIV